MVAKQRFDCIDRVALTDVAMRNVKPRQTILPLLSRLLELSFVCFSALASSLCWRWNWFVKETSMVHEV